MYFPSRGGVAYWEKKGLKKGEFEKKKSKAGCISGRLSRMDTLRNNKLDLKIEERNHTIGKLLEVCPKRLEGGGEEKNGVFISALKGTDLK